MTRMKWCAILALILIMANAPLFAVAGSYPEKPIEFVTHSAPGGGGDIFARHIVNLMEKEKLAVVPLVVVNKAGEAVPSGYRMWRQRKGSLIRFLRHPRASMPPWSRER